MLKNANDIVVLDNGGTHIRIGHIRNGSVCKKYETLSSQQLCVPHARKELLAIISAYIQKYELTIKAAVLGIPGMLDRNNDVISHCNNIPQLEGSGLQKYLSEALDCQVLFEQDIMLQLLGEWRYGAGRSCNSLFGVYFGTGIGAAFLVNGDPLNAPVQDIQAGHIPIMAEGRLCKCGNTDCIEAYACGHTLIELACRSDCPVDQLFKHGHQYNAQINLSLELEKFIRYQAYMLATVCTMFTPDLIIIGGGVPMMAGYPGEALLQTTRKHLQKPYPANSARFAWANLADKAALYGALALLDIEQNRRTPFKNEI